MSSRSAGTVFEVKPSEIQKADTYKVADVKRVTVVLESGRQVWVYIDARTMMPES